MGKRINTASSATLNVIWTPLRHGVRWVETPEEVPPWDITLDPNGRYSVQMSYQDFLALDSAAQQTELEKMRDTSYALGGYRPPSGLELQPPYWKDSYPRLVMRWPGLDKDALHLPISADYDKFGALPKWTARGLVWKAIRNLFPLARVKHKREQFKAAIIEVVHRFALLFPDKGDTLQNWYDAVLEVEYISRLLKESFRISREESGKRKISGAEILYGEALKLARELSRDNQYAPKGKNQFWDAQADKINSSYVRWDPDNLPVKIWDADNFPMRDGTKGVRDPRHKFEPDFDLFAGGLFAGGRGQVVDSSWLAGIGTTKTALEFRNHLGEALRYEVKGLFLYSPLGPSLSTGAWTWARAELAEELSSISSRRCIECGALLTNRAGAEVCSEKACRDARDKKKAGAKSQRPRPTRKSATTAPQSG